MDISTLYKNKLIFTSRFRIEVNLIYQKNVGLPMP